MGSLSHSTPYVAPPAYSSTVVAQVLNNWTHNSGGLSGSEVAYSPERGLFAIGPNVFNNSIWTSRDTLNWVNAGTPPFAGSGYGIAWNSASGLFLACGDDGAGHTKIYYSPDCVNWTLGNIVSGAYNTGYQFANNGLVTVNTAAGGIRYSLDGGKNWTAGNGHGGYSYYGVAYSPALGLFSALSGGVAGVGIAAISTDGMNWQTYQTPINVDCRQMAWCAGINLFVAANDNFQGPIGSGQILASTNGAVWSVVTPALAVNLNNPWSCIWSPDLGCVIMTPVNYTLGDPACVYSFDGKTWYGSTQQNMNTRSGIWSSDFGVFVMAGANNDGVYVSGIPAGKSDFISINTGTIFAGSGYTGQKSSGNPVAGTLGEIILAETLKGNAVALASGVTANVAQITLTPGEWDVDGNVDVSPAATTVLGNVQQGSSTASATLGAQDTFSADTYQVTSTIDLSHVIPRQRYSVAANTTIYLVVNATFTTSTCTAYGTIRARRVG